MTVTLDDEIAELKRELHIRRRKYPQWVTSGQMTQDTADLQMARMEATLNRLLAIKAEKEPVLL